MVPEGISLKRPRRSMVSTARSASLSALLQAKTCAGFLSAEILFGQGQANPSHNIIPLAVLWRRVIDQHAVHETAGAVAAIVPSAAVSDAGHGEKTGRHSSVLYVSRGPHFLKEDCGRIIARIRNRFYRQIGTVIPCPKLTTGRSLRGSRVFLEDRYGNIDTQPGFRNCVSSPLHRCGSDGHWDRAWKDEGGEQPADEHAETSEFVLA